ncbi:MAG: ATP-binding cassette domain-containing protein [Acidobacteriota bacterium]|nr:ATP-binding cassette domain-containing protein [Acidobacteriota bacterium]
MGKPFGFTAYPLHKVIVSNARASLLTMLAAMLAVLLVVCLNLGVLMTARASQRARQIALRIAIRATRSSVLQLMMVECLLLALVGGGLGILLARAGTPVLLRVSQIAIPQLQRGSGMPVLLTLAVAGATTVLSGLLPALGVFRQDANLSGGQQQLVSVARALIHKPSLLLAYEPTGKLPSEQAKEIMQLFRRLNDEWATILQVTHAEANAAYGSRVIELRDGWLSRDTAELVTEVQS